MANILVNGKNNGANEHSHFGGLSLLIGWLVVGHSETSKISLSLMNWINSHLALRKLLISSRSVLKN